MRQIVGAWRQAKQCLKDLDHRCSRSRRLKARKYLENLTNIALSSAGLKNCRQVVS
ncbi:unnamed protein product [Trichobilharzia regenti]|nr:unnamed protein product [Trichobilharzia regenti]